jgi:hypothetical protein
MSDADDKARDRADLLFFWERMQAVVQSTGYDGNAIGEAYRRYVLDLLRSRTPGPRMLQGVADELEELWWPKKYREKAFLRYADYLQNDLTALLLKCKPGTEVEKKAAAELGITVEALRRRPRTEAEKLTAKELGVDISGLRQRRYRYRKRTGI